MSFDPQEPVNEIFLEIKEYTEITYILKDPISEPQKWQLAYVVLLKTKKFKSRLKDWEKQPKANKMWDNFQKYFW